MDSIEWKCKNWILYFKKSDNFHLIHLIVKKLDKFIFHPLFCYCITNCYYYHTHVRDLNTFLKIYTPKVRILQRRKTRLWKTFKYTKKTNLKSNHPGNFGIQNTTILNIKMSAKLNKIDLSVEFMAIWWEEQTLWDIPIVSRQKWKRQKFEKNVR